MRLEDFLKTATETRTCEKGDIIFNKDEQADAAYYILSGKVEIFTGPENAPSILAHLGPGEIFGEMALLRFDKYTLSARAAETSKLHIITPDILHSELRAAHPLLKALIGMLIDRVHDTNEALISQEHLATA
jgi:CRP-like cAMP-binding protein